MSEENMVEIPPQPVDEATVTAWFNAVKALNEAKSLEMLLRKRIFGFHFPNAEEGTNSIDMPYGPPGYEMVGTRKVERKVEIAIAKAMDEQFQKAQLPIGDLIVYKPELSLKAYRKLEEDKSEEGKARLLLFDQCLIIKDGAPELKIREKPKK